MGEAVICVAFTPALIWPNLQSNKQGMSAWHSYARELNCYFFKITARLVDLQFD